VAYDALLKGTEIAKDSIGTYGTAANCGVRGLGQIGPKIAKRFDKDQEVVADGRAVRYLVKAGYDPRGYQEMVDRLAHIPMDQVKKFVLYMHTHPPFRDRRTVLESEVGRVDFKSGSIEFRKDMLNEVRQLTLNAASESIVFKTLVDAHPGNPVEFDAVSGSKRGKFAHRKRWSWF